VNNLAKRHLIILTFFLFTVNGAIHSQGLLSTIGGLNIDLPRHSYKRGELIKVAITGPAKERVKISVEDLKTDKIIPLGDFSLPQTSPFVLNTTDLRAGDYILKAESEKESDSFDISIRPILPPKILFGTFGGWENNTLTAYFKELSSCGGDHDYINCSPSLAYNLDSAYKYGINLIPNGVRVDFSGIPEEKYSQSIIDPEGNFIGYKGISPMSPVALKLMEEKIERIIEPIKDYPGFYAFSLDDEYSLWNTFWKGGHLWGDYSPWTLKYFKQETGIDAPMKNFYKELGSVIKKDEPYLLWLRYIGMPGGDFKLGFWNTGPAISYYAVKMKEVISKINPGIKVVRLIGSNYGELDAHVARIYCNGFGESVAGSGWPELSAACIIDMQKVWDKNEEKKPVWAMIGWFRKDFPIDPETKRVKDWVRLDMSLPVKISLAYGVESVEIVPFTLRHNPDLRKEFIDLGKLIKEYGPMFLNLKREQGAVAVLYSEVNEGYQRVSQKWNSEKKKWEPRETGYVSPLIWYPAMMLAGIPIQLISDEDVLSGKLERFSTLILMNFQYTTSPILNKINEYVKNGGKVFINSTSVIRPEGSILIPEGGGGASNAPSDGCYQLRTHITLENQVHQLISGFQTIIPYTEVPISLDSTYVTYTLSKSGNSKYLFLYNSDLWKEYYTTVTINEKVNYIYNILSHQLVDTERASNKTVFLTTVPKGNWQIFLLSPEKIDSIGIKLTQKGNKVNYRIQVLDPQGKILSGSFPFKVDITDAEKQVTPYSCYLATEEGEVNHFFYLAKNDAKGIWKIEVEELISKKKTEKEFTLRKNSL
jgi:hypothetical protein